jgi:hypothetical protein
MIVLVGFLLVLIGILTIVAIASKVEFQGLWFFIGSVAIALTFILAESYSLQKEVVLSKFNAVKVIGRNFSGTEYKLLSSSDTIINVEFLEVIK